MSLNRKAVVIQLAPVAPACFPSRSAWLAYLTAAVSDGREEHAQSPLLLSSVRPTSFNWSFNWCADCTEAHSHSMYVAGRCDPAHLLHLAPKRPDTPNPLALEAGNQHAEGDESETDDSTTDFGELA